MSDVVVKTFTYAAANASEAVWSDSVAAWTLAGDAAKVAFEASGNAIIAGALASSTETISVPADISIGHVTIDTPSDLTFVGPGTLGGLGTITKTGTGTLMFNGASLGDQSLVIAKGKLVLGADASENSLGSDSAAGGGTVTIADGAQFNLNYIGENTDGGNNNSARAEITQHKTFVIEGDGPDGRGAIVNDALDGRETHNAAWNAAFRRIELAGDATIGGIDRFDVRTRSGSPATAVSGIYGPGKKLTVKNTGYFGLVGQPIDVESVLITDGGVFRPEELAATKISIPGGITLDNGTLHAYNSTYPETVSIYVTESGGSISGQSGTTTFNGPVDVPEGATLLLETGATQNFAGGITNNGTIRVTGGTQNIISGALEGNGAWEMTGGSLFFYQPADLVSPKTIDISGGTFFYGKETTGLGKLNQKLTVNATGGAFAFNIGASTTITSDDLEVNGNLATLNFYSKNDKSVVGRIEGIKITADKIGANAGESQANFILGEGTELSATTFLINQTGNGAPSTIRMEAGSSVTVGNNLTIGDSSGSNEYRLVVDGGKLVCQETSPLHMGYQANAGYLDFLSGEIEVPGIWCRIGWWDPLTYDEKFTMDGGTLSITGAHATDPAIGGYTRFSPFIQLNNGTVTSLGDWDVQQMLAVGFGDRAGGHVTFDVGNKTVDWRTGIIGAADVTLTGTGSFLSGVGVANYMRFQGVSTGAWSIENTGVNDLSGASAFLGGLHLAEDIAATIHIGGSNLVEAVFLRTDSGQFENACTWSNAYPFACNDLTLLHAKGAESDYSNSVIMWQGQFYADTAGTWTFGGGYDDSVRIDVDGEKVMECTTWSAVANGSVDLSVGWHDFRIVQYQAGGGWGTVPSGWADVMNVGFAKLPVANTEAANYKRFDADHLPLRPAPVTGAGGTVNWHVVHEKTDWNTRTDWTFEGVTNKLSMLDIYNVVLPETLGNSVHMFDGWVFVPVAKAGDWAVYMDFDDRASLKIDGVDSGATGENSDAGHNGTIPGITTGWHRFELRVCDTGGNWGPWDGTTGQVKKPLATVTVNGVTYKFDETQFRFSHLKPVEYAGLDGAVCLDDGARLENTAASPCPIWGTLEGSGTLAGPFAFAGEANCWKVTGQGSKRPLTCVQFANANTATLAGLRKIEAVFDAKPGVALYELGDALGADPEKIALSIQDEAGNDYSENFAVLVVGDTLFLRNLKPAGMAVIIN